MLETIINTIIKCVYFIKIFNIFDNLIITLVIFNFFNL